MSDADGCTSVGRREMDEDLPGIGRQSKRFADGPVPGEVVAPRRRILRLTANWRGRPLTVLFIAAGGWLYDNSGELNGMRTRVWRKP
jgi:hypothetical protein